MTDVHRVGKPLTRGSWPYGAPCCTWRSRSSTVRGSGRQRRADLLLPRIGTVVAQHQLFVPHDDEGRRHLRGVTGVRMQRPEQLVVFLRGQRACAREAGLARGSVRWPARWRGHHRRRGRPGVEADLVAHHRRSNSASSCCPQPLLKRVQPFPGRLAEGRNIDRDALGGFPYALQAPGGGARRRWQPSVTMRECPVAAITSHRTTIGAPRSTNAYRTLCARILRV